MLNASNPVIAVEWPDEPLDAEPLDDLVSASRHSNREAQQRLYESCHQRVYRLLVRMVGRSDADDLLQQVFLQVFRMLSQFSGHSRFETWLYRVSVNESLQHLRHSSGVGAVFLWKVTSWTACRTKNATSTTKN